MIISVRNVPKRRDRRAVFPIEHREEDAISRWDNEGGAVRVSGAAGPASSDAGEETVGTSSERDGQ